MSYGSTNGLTHLRIPFMVEQFKYQSFRCEIQTIQFNMIQNDYLVKLVTSRMR